MAYSIEDLGELTEHNGCIGYGINKRRRVVGGAVVTGVTRHAIARSTDGTVVDLGSPVDPSFISSANAINVDGFAVGSAAVDRDYTFHAFLIRPDGTFSDLGLLVDRMPMSERTASSRSSSSIKPPMLRGQSKRRSGRAAFDGPQPHSEAQAINNSNEIVGT